MTQILNSFCLPYLEAHIPPLPGSWGPAWRTQCCTLIAWLIHCVLSEPTSQTVMSAALFFAPFRPSYSTKSSAPLASTLRSYFWRKNMKASSKGQSFVMFYPQKPSLTSTEFDISLTINVYLLHPGLQ